MNFFGKPTIYKGFRTARYGKHKGSKLNSGHASTALPVRTPNRAAVKLAVWKKLHGLTETPKPKPRRFQPHWIGKGIK